MANDPTIAVRIRAEGADAVQAAIQRTARAAQAASESSRQVSRKTFESAADAAREKWGMAGREISKTFADFGRTGEVAGRELKSLAILGGEMAMTFGPAGPIASAVALLTLGIVTMFKRARDEEEETRKQFLKGLSDMAAGADYGAIQTQAAKLYRGAYNTKTMQFENGAQQLLAREKELQPTNAFDLGAPGRLKQFYAQKITSPLDGKELTVEQLLEQYRDTLRIMQEPLTAARGPRGAVTTTANIGKEREAEKKKHEDELKAIGREFAGVMAKRKTTPEENAAIERIAATLTNGESAKGVSWSPLLPDPKILQDDLRATFHDLGIWATDNLPAIIAPFRSVGQRISDAIRDSLKAGLETMFDTLFSGGGIRASVKRLGATIMAGLGQIFARVAVTAIMLSSLMKRFLEAISHMNPWLAGAVAVAMYAAASALAGAAGGATAGAGGGGSYASAASGTSSQRIVLGTNSVATAAGMQPRQATSITVIGPNDPVAQRGIQELLANANRRGS